MGKKIYQKIMNQIMGIFLPLINVITAVSIIKSIVVLLASNDVIASNSGIYQVFYAVSDGFFYFLPVFLAMTAAKKWKTDPYIAMLIPVSINNIAMQGFDTIMPLVGGAAYAQGGAALAVAWICPKGHKLRQVAAQASFTAVLGVTEPALFGVNVPLGRPMIAACLAGVVGGVMVGAAGTHCTSFAFPSFLTSVAYVGPGFLTFLASMVVSFVLGFLFTLTQKMKVSEAIKEKEFS